MEYPSHQLKRYSLDLIKFRDWKMITYSIKFKIEDCNIFAVEC